MNGINEETNETLKELKRLQSLWFFTGWKDPRRQVDLDLKAKSYQEFIEECHEEGECQFFAFERNKEVGCIIHLQIFKKFVSGNGRRGSFLNMSINAEDFARFYCNDDKEKTECLLYLMDLINKILTTEALSDYK